MEERSRKDELALILCALARDPTCTADRYIDMLEEFERHVRKEVFDYFDKYSAVKDDKWYIELKEKFAQ